MGAAPDTAIAFDWATVRVDRFARWIRDVQTLARGDSTTRRRGQRSTASIPLPVAQRGGVRQRADSLGA